MLGALESGRISRLLAIPNLHTRGIAVISLLLLLACTDAQLASVKALGNSGHITCYSGGQVIYDGVSTGRIASEEHSDGWLLMDSQTGLLVRVSGDCVIRN